MTTAVMLRALAVFAFESAPCGSTCLSPFAYKPRALLLTTNYDQALRGIAGFVQKIPLSMENKE